MRVMLDTNVLISAIVLGSAAMRSIVEDAALHHELAVGAYVLDELRDVTARKWPDRSAAIEAFIRDAGLKVVETPSAGEAFGVAMRDPKDQPVLAEAICGKADVLVTGDRDFESLGIAEPEIVTPAQYIERYITKP